ncbi:MAG: hypothetical protein FWC15_04760 [Fibromonadales bacterium]|nr:hypothetical protein [Fibromonadales bacterium]
MSELNSATEKAGKTLEEDALDVEVRDMEKRLALLEKGAALSVSRSLQGKK